MKYFGTDGIRGIYGEKLTENLAFNAGLAASRLFEICFVGTDTRPSGEPLAAALVSGLRSGGCKVKKVGILPTPALSLLSGKYGAGGIAVTASHNPPEYNGLKFFYKGYKLTSTCESIIEDNIDCPPAHIGGGSVGNYDGRSEYIDYLLDTAKSDLSGRKIAIDCSHGAASVVAKEVFERCGASVTALACDLDGEKINCGVGALHPENVLGTAPLCFAFDGDADRLAVTDNGVVDGDSLIHNLTCLLRPSGVVGTVMNNLALEVELRRLNIPFVRTAVGDKHISEAMRLYGYELGGEQSGHFIVSPATSGDALLSALLLGRLDELRRLELVPQREASVISDRRILEDERFTEEVKECRKKLLSGRLVVRMSGTEPKIRFMAEGENERTLEEVIERLSETTVSINKEFDL